MARPIFEGGEGHPLPCPTIATALHESSTLVPVAHRIATVARRSLDTVGAARIFLAEGDLEGSRVIENFRNFNIDVF